MEKLLIICVAVFVLFTLIMCAYIHYFYKLGKLDDRAKKVKGVLLWTTMMPLILLAILAPIKMIQDFNLDVHRLIGVFPFVFSVIVSLLISKEKVIYLMEVQKRPKDSLPD